jgi:hypothetical protein
MLMDISQSIIDEISRAMLVGGLDLVCLPIALFRGEGGFGILTPVLTVVCLSIILYHHVRHTESPLWYRFAKGAVYCLPWLPPLLLMASLILLSWRGSILLGHWPLPFTDDPSVICKGDVLFQTLYSLSGGMVALTAGSIVIWFALMLHLGLRGLLTLRPFLQLTLTGYLVWTLIASDPSLRLEWWID